MSEPYKISKSKGVWYVVGPGVAMQCESKKAAKALRNKVNRQVTGQ